MRISDWSSDVCSSDLNLKEEFNQLFYETWAGIEENFYDGNFHGVDWKKIRDRYANYLPFLNNRADLRVLLNDMRSEEHTSELQSLMRISYAVFCLKNKTTRIK